MVFILIFRHTCKRSQWWFSWTRPRQCLSSSWSEQSACTRPPGTPVRPGPGCRCAWPGRGWYWPARCNTSSESPRPPRSPSTTPGSPAGPGKAGSLRAPVAPSSLTGFFVKRATVHYECIYSINGWSPLYRIMIWKDSLWGFWALVLRSLSHADCSGEEKPKCTSRYQEALSKSSFPSLTFFHIVWEGLWCLKDREEEVYIRTLYWGVVIYCIIRVNRSFSAPTHDQSWKSNNCGGVTFIFTFNYKSINSVLEISAGCLLLLSGVFRWILAFLILGTWDWVCL